MHYLAFKYAEQRKEHLRNLNLFCNLQMYATLILNLIYFKGIQREFCSILAEHKKTEIGN